MTDTKRYEVVDAETGDAFGNHTYPEVVSRAMTMRRNWNYRKQFTVRERKS